MIFEKSLLLLQFLCLFGIVNAQNPDVLYQKFSMGYDSLEAEVIADLYTEDAEVLYLYQNSKPNSYKGKAAIKTSFEKFFEYTRKEKRKLKLVFKVIKREEYGDQILDNAYYKMTVKIPDQADFIDYGKISTVLQIEDGEWKFKTDASTTATKEEFEKAKSIPSPNEGALTITLIERSDEDQIRMINEAYLSSWLKNDESGVLNLFMEDARISPNSLAPIDSLHNMKQFWFPNDGSTTTIHQFDAAELSLKIDGDIAYATQRTILDWSYVKGEFKMGQTQKGIDTSVYKRQSDGTWKIWRKSWIDYEVSKR